MGRVWAQRRTRSQRGALALEPALGAPRFVNTGCMPSSAPAFRSYTRPVHWPRRATPADAIIGVTFFAGAEGSDGAFDSFGHAFIAMFRIMTGRCSGRGGGESEGCSESGLGEHVESGLCVYACLR